MELAQDRVQWLALVLAVLNLGVLLPESLFFVITLREAPPLLPVNTRTNYCVMKQSGV
jgi:hypothetical protein